MTLSGIHAYFRGPKPPFAILAGPIAVQSQERAYELSARTDAELELALEDVEVAWAGVGQCWSIQSDLGEPVWAGFVKKEKWPFEGESIILPLTGPLEGLLEVDMTPGQAVRQAAGKAIEFAVGSSGLSETTAVFAGNIEEGPVLEIDERGDTIAGFIEALVREAGMEWMERTVETETGLEFRIDVGTHLKDPTRGATITDADVIEGLFVRDRPVSGLTMYSGGQRFSERAVKTILIAGQPSTRPADSVYTLGEPDGTRIQNRLTDGPAVGKHLHLFSERLLSPPLVEATRARFIDLLRGVDELLLTLDTSRAAVQNLRVTDQVSIDIKNWSGKFDVQATGVVSLVEPHEEDGTKDVAVRLQ